MPRTSTFGRLLDHFNTHPKGRLHEFLFWSAIGVLFGALAIVGWLNGAIAPPFALMMAVVAACFVGWSFLPQRKVVAPPSMPAKSKRARR